MTGGRRQIGGQIIVFSHSDAYFGPLPVTRTNVSCFETTPTSYPPKLCTGLRMVLHDAWQIFLLMYFQW